MQKISYTAKEIRQVAKLIIQNAATTALAFQGPMGAGKTTLIKSIVKELGGKNEVSSPTFGLVNEYEYENGDLLGYHFDFYRLNDETEALDLGLEDYFSADVWIFMEWPEKIPNLLPERFTKLQIEILGPDERRITIDF
ncbi:tRNA (adenosine(37)-N6)-threonylcarbamoyltransferase complex ATPase subunit type 1 TsaE [Maribacter aestuarii]|uniref:tRNA (adenosine(37)-N6)-threonylcarbamoyltransferase complex ATPase subunit type 1 TsaE n=1 Tax=Maribacter aestuarii TaxID=1130723 RepID=UPI00248C4683|nr:tRNA (adenosine(37)-N6)-threonylcarbamoyltransferase complex ATPase subunit type 1 TsaE [Maribacter aestuarii]